MTEIVFLHEFPKAAGFCVEYIVRHWEYSRKQAENFVAPCLHRRKLPFLLVARQRNPVGMIMASSSNSDVTDDYSPWLFLLYVRPGFRNNGTGSMLLERACFLLAEAGYKKAYVDTVGAEDFYRRKGWAFVGTRPWRDETTSIFCRRLNNFK